jgi:hypothetical protein
MFSNASNFRCRRVKEVTDRSGAVYPGGEGGGGLLSDGAASQQRRGGRAAHCHLADAAVGWGERLGRGGDRSAAGLRAGGAGQAGAGDGGGRREQRSGGRGARGGCAAGCIRRGTCHEVPASECCES